MYKVWLISKPHICPKFKLFSFQINSICWIRVIKGYRVISPSYLHLSLLECWQLSLRTIKSSNGYGHGHGKTLKPKRKTVSSGVYYFINIDFSIMVSKKYYKIRKAILRKNFVHSSDFYNLENKSSNLISFSLCMLDFWN